MPEQGRVHYTYFVGPGEGIRLDLECIAYEDYYSAMVLLNGVRVRRARRKHLRAALHWASDVAADILVTMGVTPPQQLAFDRLTADADTGPGFVA